MADRQIYSVLRNVRLPEPRSPRRNSHQSHPPRAPCTTIFSLPTVTNRLVLAFRTRPSGLPNSFPQVQQKYLLRIFIKTPRHTGARFYKAHFESYGINLTEEQNPCQQMTLSSEAVTYEFYLSRANFHTKFRLGTNHIEQGNITNYCTILPWLQIPRNHALR